MKVTAELLREKRASCPQVDTFETEWKDGCEVNLPNLLRAVELELDLNWFALHCLPAPIWERYDAEIAPIRKRYHAEVAPIWTRYHAEIAPIRDRYDAEIATIRKRYDAEIATIRKRYDAEVATIIAQLVNK